MGLPRSRSSAARWAAGVLRACAVLIAIAPGGRRVDDDAPPSGEGRMRPATVDAGEGVRPAGSHSTIVVPDFAAVASRVGPSVVTVIATVREPEGDTKSKVVRGVGSGMIV